MPRPGTMLPLAQTEPTTAIGVACSRSGHRKDLNPVPIFARFGEPICMRLAAMRAVSFCSAIPALRRKTVHNSGQRDRLLSL
jgi:hypothetical protein